MPHSIFGPVPSRRLGRSLGVDLIPYKTCSFDCIYCELGETTCHTKERRSYKNVDHIWHELKDRLSQLKGEVDFITLAGSGEPTLNKDLGSIIEKIKSMTDYPLAILTNSSLLEDPLVRAEIKPLDLIVPSLDAVSREIFQKINQPCQGIDINRIIEGLIKLREEFAGDIWLEVLMCKGINDREMELSLIKKAIHRIRPDKIQINTVFRPPSLEGVHPVSETRLKEIEAFLGPAAQAVGNARISQGRIMDSRSLRTRILVLLKRRPCTPEDISDALCLSRIEVVKLLDQLLAEGHISRIKHQNRIYFKANISEKD